SMDTANENWIMQDINSILQSTPWKSVDKLAAGKDNAILYAYDDEGKLVERIKGATITGGTAEHPNWQYVVKVLVDKMNRPNTENDKMEDCRNVTVVIAPFGKKKAVDEFNRLITSDDIRNPEIIGKVSDVRLRCFVLTRMDSSIE